MSLYEKLSVIQSELKAPKNQYNSFGKYKYRSCEDILEGLKPLLAEHKAVVILSDEIKQIGDRYYLEATATFIDIETGDKIEVKSLAREDETKKGMDLAQVTGSVSSYARKYALNGLFSIDDTKDSDSTNTHKGDKPTNNELNTENKCTNVNKTLSEPQIKRLYALAHACNFDKDKIKSMVKTKFNKEIVELNKTEYDHICDGLQAKLDNQGA